MGTKAFALIFGLLAVLTLGVLAYAEDVTINGAGASFPYPLYSQWAHDYYGLTGMKLNYQSIGSGGGIAQIKAKTVDFGASDEPLKKEVLDQADLIQFPMIIGGVVPVIKVSDIKGGQLKLTANILADIFLGKITKWNDPQLTKLNPNLKLPNMDITVVHRSDGSGTTWIFTNYLSKVSSEWKEKVGNDKSVAWPTGIGGKGNEGVSAYVQKVEGSIGYVEFAYALQNNLTYVSLQNKAGKFVQPTIETFSASAANADWKNAPGFYMVLTDQPGDDSWPISGASFILIHKEQPNINTAKAMLKFFDWCFRHGADMAIKLHYVPIPKNVYELVESQWTSDVQSAGKPVWQ